MALTVEVADLVVGCHCLARRAAVTAACIAVHSRRSRCPGCSDWIPNRGHRHCNSHCSHTILHTCCRILSLVVMAKVAVAAV